MMLVEAVAPAACFAGAGGTTGAPVGCCAKPAEPISNIATALLIFPEFSIES